MEKKNEFVFRIYSLLVLFEDGCSIEIVFRIAEVSIEQDSMVVEHYYKIDTVDYYYYYYCYYYLQEIEIDRIVELVLVEMWEMDLNNKKLYYRRDSMRLLRDGCHCDWVLLLFCG